MNILSLLVQLLPHAVALVERIGEAIENGKAGASVDDAAEASAMIAAARERMNRVFDQTDAALSAAAQQ